MQPQERSVQSLAYVCFGREARMLSRSNPAAVPPPIGRYHHTTTVPGGTDLVFIPGQVGHYLDGSAIAQDSAGQARQAFLNLGTILTDLSAGPGQVAKILTFVAEAKSRRSSPCGAHD
jgi:enamine deaminase RidA (YjgF/YER057c/UK114 family)